LRPAWATCFPDKREILHGGPLPRAKFHFYRGIHVGIQPPKLAKFGIFDIILPAKRDSFALFIYESVYALGDCGYILFATRPDPFLSVSYPSPPVPVRQISYST